MPTYEVTAPDGRVFEVDAPEGATQEQALAYAKKQTASPQKLDPRGEFIRNISPSFLGGRFLPDLVMGGRQVLDAAARLAAEGAATARPESSTLSGMREDTKRANLDALKDYESTFAPEKQTGAEFARGIGQGLVTAPAVPAMKAGGAFKSAAQGAGVGGAASVLTPDYGPSEGYWERLKDKIGLGAVIGGALGGAGGVLGKVATSKEAKTLLDAGVDVPPGRAAGGFPKRIEEGAESIPVVGDVIRGAHRNAVVQFDRATINKSLEPIGESLSKESTGRFAISEARKKISAFYENALNKIGRVDLDKQFSDEGVKVAQMTAELGEPVQKQFMGILKNRVFDRITPAGTMSATTMKQVDSDIGRLASGFIKSADQNQRGLGFALYEVQASLRRNVERSAGPELAAQVQAANKAWATWIRVADASTRAGSKEGVFSPAALRSAVQKGDKVGFREGNALLQKWAEGAEKVLGPEVPDSGTPLRLLTGSGLLGYMWEPSVAAAGAAIAAPYMAPGLASRLVGSVGAGAGAASPYLGLLAPSAAALLNSR